MAQRKSGISFDYRLYVDDAAIYFETSEGAKKGVEAIEDVFNLFGQELGHEQGVKDMILNLRKSVRGGEVLKDIICKDGQVSWGKKFPYLGTPICDTLTASRRELIQELKDIAAEWRGYDPKIDEYLMRMFHVTRLIPKLTGWVHRLVDENRWSELQEFCVEVLTSKEINVQCEEVAKYALDLMGVQVYSERGSLSSFVSEWRDYLLTKCWF